MAENENFGYYEKRLCFLLFLSSIPNAFSTLYIVVSQYAPFHTCALQDLWSNQTGQVLTFVDRWNKTYP